MKIYNEVISRFNEVTGEWEDISENSFEYTGPLALAGAASGNWGALGSSGGRREAAAKAWQGLKQASGGEESMSGITTKEALEQTAKKGKTPLQQLENIGQNPKGGSLDMALGGSTGIKGLPSRFSEAIQFGAPAQQIQSKGESLLGRLPGVQEDYASARGLDANIASKAGDYKSGLLSSTAAAQSAIEGAQDALATAQGNELNALTDLYSYYGANPSDYTPSEGVSLPETMEGQTKQEQEAAQLSSSLENPLRLAREGVGDYGTSMTGPEGLFGTGSQVGFGINPETGMLDLPSAGELYEIDSETGDIEWAEGINPGDYGGEIFSLLDSIRKADEAQDLTQGQTEESYSRDVDDAARDLRLAKEGKLDFSTKTRRDVQKLQKENLQNQLQSEGLRNRAGSFYSGPTERVISSNAGDLKANLENLISQHRSGIRGQEEAIKELREGRERTEKTYEDDIKKIISDRKDILSGTITPGLEGLQGTAQSNFDTLSGLIGEDAALNIVSGAGQATTGQEGESDPYSQAADSLTLEDILGLAPGDAPQMTGTAPELSYSLPSGGNYGSIGQDILGAYNQSQGRLDNLADAYGSALSQLNPGIQSNTADAARLLAEEEIAGPENLKTQLRGLQGDLGQSIADRAMKIGQSGTAAGGPGGAGFDPLSDAYTGLTGLNDIDLSSVGGSLAGQNLLGDITMPLGDQNVTIDSYGDIPVPLTGTLGLDEAALRAPLESLYSQVLSPEGQAYTRQQELINPAEGIITDTQQATAPAMSDIQSGAGAAQAAEDEYGGKGDSFESNIQRADYATPDVGKYGGVKRHGFYGGTTQLGGAAREYFPRLKQVDTPDEWGNIKLPGVEKIKQALVTPANTTDLNMALSQALGGIVGAGGAGEGLRGGGFLGSVLNPNMQADTLAQLTNQALGLQPEALAPTTGEGSEATPQDALVQYLTAQGII